MTKAPTAPKLGDMHRVLLATAGQRADGSLLPLPSTIAAKVAPAHMAMTTLLKRQLAAEQPTNTAAAVWRQEGDQQLALVITSAGRTAIGLAPAEPPAEVPKHALHVRRASKPATAERAVVEPATQPLAVSAEPAPRSAPGEPKVNKRAAILKLMRRKRGATMDELMTATGWLAHSTRGALSTLRTRGITVERSRRGATSVYRVVEPAE